MKKILASILITVLFTGCAEEYLKNKKYNPDAVSEKSDTIWRFKNYRSTSSRSSSPSSNPRQEIFAFRTIRPVRRSASGNWYHRFSLSRMIFRNPEKAVHYVNKTIASFYKEDREFRDKRWGPLYIMITGRIVYRLSSGFYMAGWINRRFRELCKKVLPSGIPEKGSVVTTRHRPGKGYFLLR